jgi:mRNA-degrading endonuclease RelE of RelBE toxin-antitoxin system
MNKLEKLFKRISHKEREALLSVIDELLQGGDIRHLKPIKLSGLELFRIRKGDFRIIFHIESGRVIIDSIRLRNEKTYKL